MTDETLAWARDRWEDDVLALYDDPVGFAEVDGTDTPDEAREKVAGAHNWLNRVGLDLGMQMSVTIARGASEVEIRRMEGLIGAPSGQPLRPVR